jgi:hypothetical protein
LQEFVAHASVLGHGLSLLHPPTISEALDGNLAWSGTSSERSFLLDFIDCTPDTSGGRLAAYVLPLFIKVDHFRDIGIHCLALKTLTLDEFISIHFLTWLTLVDF